MPIFESIQKAEAQAEQIRLEASQKVDQIMESSRQRIQEERKRIQAETEARIAEIETKAKLDAIKEQNKVMSLSKSNDAIVLSNAAKRIDLAVDAIMKRVFGT